MPSVALVRSRTLRNLVFLICGGGDGGDGDGVVECLMVMRLSHVHHLSVDLNPFVGLV